MQWQVVVTESAEKQIRRLPKAYADRIRFAIDAMETNPFQGDIVKLSGEENAWRRRIGDYRIVYKLTAQKRTVYIYDIRRRTTSMY